MEFWLTKDNERLQLPVPPPNFSITQGSQVNIVNVNEVGEVGLIGRGQLATIDLTTFFPAKEYPFCQYRGFPSPYEFTALVKRWKEEREPIRLIITDTDINLSCMIESFTYGERDGTGDLYFTLQLREYRHLRVTTTLNNALSSPLTRPTEREPSASYIVKRGDTLWAIAKREYGNGDRWREIATKNNIKDPTKLQIGQRLLL